MVQVAAEGKALPVKSGSDSSGEAADHWHGNPRCLAFGGLGRRPTKRLQELEFKPATATSAAQSKAACPERAGGSFALGELAPRGIVARGAGTPRRAEQVPGGDAAIASLEAQRSGELLRVGRPALAAVRVAALLCCRLFWGARCLRGRGQVPDRQE